HLLRSDDTHPARGTTCNDVPHRRCERKTSSRKLSSQEGCSEPRRPRREFGFQVLRGPAMLSAVMQSSSNISTAAAKAVPPLGTRGGSASTGRARAQCT